MIDFSNRTVFKLKENADFAERVSELLVEGERAIASFKAMRDGVVFTDRRVIAVNVQGLTGSKRAFTSLPYRAVVAWAVETSGTFDRDAELEMHFSSLGVVRFEFSGRTDIRALSALIAEHAL